MDSERRLVEDYIIHKLTTEKGWKFIRAGSLRREDLREPLIIPDLIEAIKRINSDVRLTEGDINRVISEIKLAPATMEGVRKVLRALKHGVPIKLEKERTIKYIQLIDYNQPENNDFIVSRQVQYIGLERIRVDIILYINGIPTVLIECKSPIKPVSYTHLTLPTKA